MNLIRNLFKSQINIELFIYLFPKKRRKSSIRTALPVSRCHRFTLSLSFPLCLYLSLPLASALSVPLAPETVTTLEQREKRHGGRVKNSTASEYNIGTGWKKERKGRKRERGKSDDACLLNRLNKRQRAQRWMGPELALFMPSSALCTGVVLSRRRGAGIHRR